MKSKITRLLFSLQKCGKAFSREHHLKRHMKGVHFGDKQKQYFYRKSDTPTVQQPSLNSSPMKGYSTIKMVEALEDNDTVLYCTDESGNTVILQHVTKDFNSDQYIVSDDSGINIKNGKKRTFVLKMAYFKRGLFVFVFYRIKIVFFRRLNIT